MASLFLRCFMNLHESTLYLSQRSPFARRVRLALLENQINFNEMIVDVFNPSVDFIKVAPLGRVPTLILKNGIVLYESHIILQALFEEGPNPLLPHDEKERAWVYHWSALATGLCEKTIEQFLESQKPQEKQNAEVFQEFLELQKRILGSLETYLTSAQKPQGDFLGHSFTQADIDITVALSYMSLRTNKEWEKTYPLSTQYVKKIEARPLFVKTFPKI